MIFAIFAFIFAIIALFSATRNKKWDKLCIVTIFISCFFIILQFNTNNMILQKSCSSICGDNNVIQCNNNQMICRLDDGKTLVLKTKIK